MRNLLPLLFIACIACENGDGDAQRASAVGQSVGTARAFFEQLGDEPVRLFVGELGSEAEIETFNWIRDSAERATNDEFIGFILKRLNPLSVNSYALQLHRRDGYPELETGKRYVEVHFLRIVSDPEIHGIVDVDEMNIVSIVSDGGA